MRLDDLLFSQGFGTRRVCAGIIERGLVKISGGICDDAGADIDVTAGEIFFSVQGVDWQYQEKAYLMLNKPAGYECSQKPSAWPSVYTLLPAPLRQRPSMNKTAGVQAIGRLDQDTTGLLLFSDDGAFIHKMNSPKHKVPKVYEVELAREITDLQIKKLLAGVVLNDDPAPVSAFAAEITGEKSLKLTLTQGKYHQVKRMLAAVGNHVEQLSRSQIGELVIPTDLKQGQWAWINKNKVI